MSKIRHGLRPLTVPNKDLHPGKSCTGLNGHRPVVIHIRCAADQQSNWTGLSTFFERNSTEAHLPIIASKPPSPPISPPHTVVPHRMGSLFADRRIAI
jgi:hypothetical protein